jgi:CotH kinase protein/PA14 domain/Lamin Tail Domain/Fn3 associated
MIRSTFWLLFLSLLSADSLFAVPRMTEVLASNKSGLADENGDRSDWIEVHNPDSSAIDLNGWSLSDDAAQPMKWRFPAVTLPAGGYLVVFCSNKNRAVAGSELHSNFELNSGGETLFLTQPNGTTVQQLKFTQQYPDMAYDGADYLSPPTPGASNAAATVAIVRAPVFSEARGFKSKAFNLTLTSGMTGAQIFYTLDGNDPTATSLRFNKPIRIAKTTVVRAVALVSGKQASPVITSTYLFAADMVKQSLNGKAPPGWPSSWGINAVDYGMDSRIASTGKFAKALPNALQAIPTMAITMPLPGLFDPGGGIYSNPGQKGIDWERAASIELLNAEAGPGFQINAGLRIRGGASRSQDNPKHSFRVLMRKEYGAEFLDYPLFGEQGAPRTERFDLRCEQLVAWHYFVDPKADFIRDIYGRTIQGALGQPYNRSHFYHLVINGQYWGLYQTEERVGAEYATSYFGGDESDYDVIKVNFDNDNFGGGTDFVDGSFGAWRRAVTLGAQGFEDDANYFLIQGKNADGSRNPNLTPLIDVDNLIDYMIAGIYIAAEDSPPAFGTQNNWSGIRSRKGDFGFRFFAHDWEISMMSDSGDEDRVGAPPSSNPFLAETTVIDPTSANPWHFWQAMRANEEFRLRVADHVQKHFFHDGPLVQTKATALWRQFMETIDQAIIGESARWGDARNEGGIRGSVINRQAEHGPVRAYQLDAGQDEDDVVQGNKIIGPGPTNPKPPTGSTKKPIPFTRDDWLNACNTHILGGFLANRTSYVLQHFKNGGLLPNVGAPDMAPFGGLLSAGTNVTLTPPEVENIEVPVTLYYTTNGSDPRLVGGGISTKARAYTAPISLDKDTTIKARSYQAGQWSALTEAKFEVSTDYGALRITELNYNPPAPASDSAEFVELQNTGTTPLNLGGIAFTEGIDYVFPNATTLGAGAVLVIARDPASFQQKYGFTPYGPYTGKLSNEGETITLSSPSGSRITSLRYDDEDGWPTAPDGFGRSLVFDGKGDADLAKNWFASPQLGGSPGTLEQAPALQMQVFINEIIQDPSGVIIELQNTSEQEMDLSGWTLISGATQRALPAGLTLAGFSKAMLSGADLTGLTFDSTGGTLALQRPIQTPAWRDAVHRFKYGPLTTGVSYARHLSSDGRESFPQQQAPTPNATDAGPLIPELRITEIYYHPKPPIYTGPPLLPQPELEFIEIYNAGSASVDLSGYRVSGLNFVFPDGTVLGSQSLAVITMADAGFFRRTYGVPPEVIILGNAPGTLDHAGERIALEAPVTVSGNAAFAVLEEFIYGTSASWSPLASGRGHSLQRLNFPGYCADPSSWSSARPSPGLLNTVNAAPTASLSQLPGLPNARTLEFRASGSDVDGHVSKMEFIVNGSVTAETSEPTFTFSYAQTRGIHDVWIRVTDDQGAATLSDAITLDAETLPDGAGQGLYAEYFQNTELEGQPAHTETVTTVGGDWYHIDPAPGVSRSEFSVRYSGKFVPRSSGRHSFFFQATGGLRAWIGNAQVVDAWTDPQSVTGQSFTFELDLTVAQEVPIVIEYRDVDGLAYLNLLLQEPGSYNLQPPLAALLYGPSQDINAAAIGAPSGVETRYLGQKVSYLFRLLNASISDEVITWSVMSGDLPTGLSLSSRGELSGSCRVAGQFECVLQATLPDSSKIQRSLTMRVIDRNVRAPILVIKDPKPIVATSRFSGITVRGTATSSRPIAALYYSLNGGLQHRFTGAAQWSLDLPHAFGLVGGTNELYMHAVDVDGRITETVKHLFSRQYPSPLTVELEGAGSLSPGFLGVTTRTVGKEYKIIAKPAPGFMFSHWSGNAAFDDPNLLFAMTDEMRIKAHFVVSPFTAHAGHYTGLLTSDSLLSQNTRCRVRLSLTQLGGISGVLNYDALPFTFTGRFTPQGTTFFTAINQKTGRTLFLSILFDLQTGSLSASAALYIKDEEHKMTSILSQVNTRPSPQHIGRWNLLLAPSIDSPQGQTPMTLVVSRLGDVMITGSLPTGRSFTDASQITVDRTVPIYISLSFDPATGRKEAITGVTTFSDGQNSLPQASYYWAAAFEPYESPSDIFVRELISDGYRYRSLSRTESFLPTPYLDLFLTGGRLSERLRIPVNLGKATSYHLVTFRGETLKYALNRATGSITGSLTIPAKNGLPRQTLQLRALAQPEANRAGGYFISNDGSIGNVEINQSR